MGNRIKTALKFLKDGQAFKVGALRLSAEKANVIEVTGWSNYKNFKYLSKQQCLNELEQIKGFFQKLLEHSKELNHFMENRSVQYHFYFDSYSKGSIGICSEINGAIEWEINIEDE